jgi:hypothetical protein
MIKFRVCLLKSYLQIKFNIVSLEFSFSTMQSEEPNYYYYLLNTTQHCVQLFFYKNIKVRREKRFKQEGE